MATIAAVGAALVAFSLPAVAAEPIPAPAFGAPVAPTVTGDLTIYGGIGWHNYDGSTWWAATLGGTARGTYWLPSGMSIQLDVLGEGYRDTYNSYVYAVANAAAHFGWGDPNRFLAGGFLSGGVNGDYGETFGTVAVEAQLARQRATFYGQLGFSTTILPVSWTFVRGAYIHTVAAFALSQRLTATAELGFARVNQDGTSLGNMLRWGAGIEAALGASPFAATLAYEGTRTVWDGTSVHNEHALLLGVKLLFNGGNGSLRADYNPFTGNHHQRYY